METGKLYPPVLWPVDHACRYREVAQPDDSASCDESRHGGDSGLCPEIRFEPEPAAAAVDVAGRRRDDIAEADLGLWHACQWRQEVHAKPDRPDPEPPWRDNLP